MPRPRPAHRWDQHYFKTMALALKSPQTLLLATPREAINLRRNFYSARLALLRHPSHNPALARQVSRLRFTVKGRKLHLTVAELPSSTLIRGARHA